MPTCFPSNQIVTLPGPSWYQCPSGRAERDRGALVDRRDPQTARSEPNGAVRLFLRPITGVWQHRQLWQGEPARASAPPPLGSTIASPSTMAPADDPASTAPPAHASTRASHTGEDLRHRT